MTRVCVAGVTGWVGRPLAEAVLAAEDLELVAAVARRSRGERLGELTISGSVTEALRVPSDVFVDYTSAAAVKANVLQAVAAGRHVVVGSSGLGDDDYTEMDAAARSRAVGVVAVGNFAISAALLQRFAAEAARHLGSWEILDLADAGKPDAPSGTAREVAWRLSQVRTPEIAIPQEATLGVPEARGAIVSGSPVHSIRLPGYMLAVQVRFGGLDERLTLTYEGGAGSGPYIEGTLLAIRRVAEFSGLVRGLDALL